MGKDFNNADKGKSFKKGGDTMAKMNPFMAMMAKKKDGAKKMASGGSVDVGNSTSMGRVATKPGNINGVASKGKTKGKQIVMSGNTMTGKMNGK